MKKQVAIKMIVQNPETSQEIQMLYCLDTSLSLEDINRQEIRFMEKRNLVVISVQSWVAEGTES